MPPSSSGDLVRVRVQPRAARDEVVRGARGRDKLVRVAGLGAGEVRRRLGGAA